MNADTVRKHPVFAALTPEAREQLARNVERDETPEAAARREAYRQDAQRTDW